MYRVVINIFPSYTQTVPVEPLQVVPKIRAVWEGNFGENLQNFPSSQHTQHRSSELPGAALQCRHRLYIGGKQYL